jgi:hypothetical protein
MVFLIFQNYFGTSGVQTKSDLMGQKITHASYFGVHHKIFCFSFIIILDNYK